MPGDLEDAIVAVLSLASLKHETPRIPLDEFYNLFIALSREFPDLIPEPELKVMTRFIWPEQPVNGRGYAVRLNVQLNPRRSLIEVRPEDAWANLAAIKKRLGDELFAWRYQRPAKRLAELVKTIDSVPPDAA